MTKAQSVRQLGISQMTWEVVRSITPYFQPSGVLGTFRGRDGLLFRFFQPCPEEFLQAIEDGEISGPMVREWMQATWDLFRWELDRRYNNRGAYPFWPSRSIGRRRWAA